MATFTRKRHAFNAASAAASSAPVARAVRRIARVNSLALVGTRSTIRLPYTLCKRTMIAVESVFKAIFCAVPAFSRVLPDTSSDPVSSVMPISACVMTGASGLLARPMVSAPRARAARIAPSTYGVVPDAASKITTSSRMTSCLPMSTAPWSSLSSAPSTAR